MKVLEFKPDPKATEEIFDIIKGKSFLAISLDHENTIHYHRVNLSNADAVFMLECMKNAIVNGDAE